MRKFTQLTYTILFIEFPTFDVVRIGLGEIYLNAWVKAFKIISTPHTILKLRTASYNFVPRILKVSMIQSPSSCARLSKFILLFWWKEHGFVRHLLLGSLVTIYHRLLLGILLAEDSLQTVTSMIDLKKSSLARAIVEAIGTWRSQIIFDTWCILLFWCHCLEHEFQNKPSFESNATCFSQVVYCRSGS